MAEYIQNVPDSVNVATIDKNDLFDAKPIK